MRRAIALAAGLCLVGGRAGAVAPPTGGDSNGVKSEHDTIGVGKETAARHTQHPGAQWYPDAGFGLFIHWGISSVRAMNISWPMIPGRPLAAKKITDPEEIQRIIREGDWNLDGKPNGITPNEYWSMAKDFNPQAYDPDKWIRAASEAGFKYAVLTTRHHEGFALWPSKYGNFNTANYMGGKDLVRPYVEACRKYGLKVGLYYSPPDWHFDREYMSFLYGGARKNNPGLPSLDADLKPRTEKKSEDDVRRHQAEFAAEVNGQIEELLTNYGQIDLIWFDGKPAAGNNPVISQARIRELQPGIVINPRLHGSGDFVTHERKLRMAEIHPGMGWAELCNTWTNAWPHTPQPFRSDGFVLGELAKCRSLGMNYLLGVGPMSTGEFCDDIYKNMGVVAGWMKANGESVHGGTPLPPGESANVDATANGQVRYLFLEPKFKGNGTYDRDVLPAEDETVTLKGLKASPRSVTLLNDGAAMKFDVDGDTVKVRVPASKRTKLVDVLKIDLAR